MMILYYYYLHFYFASNIKANFKAIYFIFIKIRYEFGLDGLFF